METVLLSPQELGLLIRNELRGVLQEQEEKKSNAEKNAEHSPKTFSVKQAAKFLNLSESRVYIKANGGEIKNFKRGNRIFFFEADLINYIKQGERYSQHEIDAAADGSLLNKHPA